MSIRALLVQYVGNVLKLPKLEREVRCIRTADEKQFVKVTFCRDCDNHVSDEVGEGCLHFDCWFGFEMYDKGFCAWGIERKDHHD